MDYLIYQHQLLNNNIDINNSSKNTRVVTNSLHPNKKNSTNLIKEREDNFSKQSEIISANNYPINYSEVLKKSITDNNINFLGKIQNNKIKPKIDYKTASMTAQRITNDKELQNALIELAQQEAIVVRTKKDATPILKEQYNNIQNKDNLVILNINPQKNNGMQKSNTLISNWYTEINNIPATNLITLETEELRTKILRPNEICSEWIQGNATAKKIERLQNKVDFISMDKTREILNDIKGKSAEEILSKYDEETIARAIKTINKKIIEPQKHQSYVGALTTQLETACQDKDSLTVVVPDDCSLSGSSILCDSIKIFDKFLKNNPNKKLHVVYSPLILSDVAENTINKFADKSQPLNNLYLRQINAIKSDGKEATKGIVKAFERVKASDNIDFEISPATLKAPHFTETEYFKSIKDPVLKSKLTYIMQGPIKNGSAQFGGFGDCGTLVITPTEEFELEGKTYAGKIPTNSVGFMEVLGHQAGVLNDEINDSKGLFTKGTGKGYTRYCEWEELAIPELPQDRIPIIITKDGSVSVIRQ